MVDVELDISAADVADFARDGFILRERIISESVVEMLRAEMAALFERDYQTGLVPDEVNWRPGDDPSVTRQICNGWKARPRLASVVLHRAIGEACARLNGWPGARIAHDNILWKPPAGDRPGGALGMHQDSAFIGWSDPSLMCTVWIALDDTTAAGGAMEFARGSHLWERRPAIDQFHAPEDYLAEFRAMTAEREAEMVPVAVPKGGGSIHHGWLWHGSGPNRTDRPRRSVVAHCLSAEASFTGEVGPVYSRYKRAGSAEMDEAFFPILWHSKRPPSGFLEGYFNGRLGWPAID
ncbi:MAG: phytanoyl-CoA dioxygenase family protein [Pseudomonadota bacterium]